MRKVNHGPHSAAVSVTIQRPELPARDEYMGCKHSTETDNFCHPGRRTSATRSWKTRSGAVDVLYLPVNPGRDCDCLLGESEDGQ